MERSSAALLKQARKTAGLTQADLAARAEITQSVISAYESGRREPALSTLFKLIDATGVTLTISIEGEKASTSELMGNLQRHKDQILRIFSEGGARSIRICGSVARGTATPESDIDFLVDLDPSVSYFELVELSQELEALLGVPVDVLPESNLHPDWREQILSEAISF